MKKRFFQEAENTLNRRCLRGQLTIGGRIDAGDLKSIRWMANGYSEGCCRRLDPSGNVRDVRAHDDVAVNTMR